MVRRYLPGVVVALGAGAVLFIASRLLEYSLFYRTEPLAIPPTVLLEGEILGPMTLLGLFLLAIGLILTAVMVRRYLLVGVAVLGAEAILFTVLFVLPPRIVLETEILGALELLGFFSFLPVGLILLAVALKRREFVWWRKPTQSSPLT
jgi:uncharacterized membrane protein YhaH (DUF805 family)